jgi:hypothetical protein
MVLNAVGAPSVSLGRECWALTGNAWAALAGKVISCAAQEALDS